MTEQNPASTGQGVSADLREQIAAIITNPDCGLNLLERGAYKNSRVADYWKENLRKADAVIAFLTTLTAQVRAETIEEAAKLCDQHADSNAYSALPLVAGIHDGFRKAARAIRALAPLPETKGGEE